MMEPKYERLRMLGEAMRAGAEHFSHPIDRLEVKGGKVIVSAGGERLVLSYHYNDNYNAQGDVLLGSGNWSVTPADDAPDHEPDGGGGLWKRLFGKR